MHVANSKYVLLRLLTLQAILKKKIAQWREMERAALRASWGGTAGSGAARLGEGDAHGGCVGGQGLREGGAGRLGGGGACK